TGEAPGRVDSPPTSRMSAPSPAILLAWATAASESKKRPPSLNESGVTLSTPRIAGRARAAIGERRLLRLPRDGGARGDRREVGVSSASTVPSGGRRSDRLGSLAVSRSAELFDDFVDVGPVEGFLLEQDLGHPVEYREIRGEQALRPVIGILDQSPDFLVDLF